MKLFIGFFAIFFLTKFGFSQAEEKLDSSISLTIYVVNEKTHEAVAGEILKIAWNNEDTLIASNKNGVVFFELEKKTDYTISRVLNDSSFMPSIDRISTKDCNKCNSFIKEILINKEKEDTYTGLPNVLYKHNSVEPYNFNDAIYVYKFISEFMIEYPVIVLKITGFRSKDEKTNISKERAIYFIYQLVKLGVNRNRLVYFDGGVFEFPSKYSSQIEYAILSWDYKE